MAGPISITEAAERRLTERLRDELAATGSARAELTELHVPVEVWRKVARRAGRELGRPIATLIVGSSVHVVLSDWPSTPAEHREHEHRKRQAITAAARPKDPADE